MKTIPSLADLLEIDERDRRGLEWTRNRARFWMTAVKRQRRYMGGEPCSEEAQLIMALLAIEAAAGELLQARVSLRPATDSRPVRE